MSFKQYMIIYPSEASTHRLYAILMVSSMFGIKEIGIIKYCCQNSDVTPIIIGTVYHIAFDMTIILYKLKCIIINMYNHYIIIIGEYAIVCYSPSEKSSMIKQLSTITYRQLAIRIYTSPRAISLKPSYVSHCPLSTVTVQFQQNNLNTNEYIIMSAVRDIE